MNLLTRACLPAVLFLFFRMPMPGFDTALTIVNAGIAQEDNGAFASHDYRFLPGDPLYVVFEIQGFHVNVNDEKDTRSVALTWEVNILDKDNVPLAPAQSGEIKTSLSSEDKKWLPKRRAEFTLPQLLTAGEYHVHITAKDLLLNTVAARDVAFLSRGPNLEPSAAITAQHLQFSRTEDGPEVEIPAYQAGDTIFIRFDLTGFAQTPSHEYNLSYRLQVLDPQGKVFVNQTEPVELTGSPFYPAKFLPVNLSVITPGTSPHGKYTIVLTFRDSVSQQPGEARCSFTIE